MGLLRSEVMKHGTLFVPQHMAASVVEELSLAHNVQYTDMNVDGGHRRNRQNIQRLDEIDRQLRFLTDEIEKDASLRVVSGNIDNIIEHLHPGYLNEVNHNQKVSPSVTTNALSEYESGRLLGGYGLDNSHPLSVDRIEKDCLTFYMSLQRLKGTRGELDKELREAIEEKHLNATAATMLSKGADEPDEITDKTFVGPVASQSFIGAPADADMAVLGGAQGDTALGNPAFTSIAGVMPQLDTEGFTRMLFRASRGFAYGVVQTIEDDEVDLLDKRTGHTGRRAVVVVWYQRGTDGYLHQKIMNLCTAFNVTLYYWPHSSAEAVRRRDKVENVILEKKHAKELFDSFYAKEVQTLLEVTRLGGNSRLKEWEYFVNKQKALLSIVDCFEARAMFLSCDVWFADSEEASLQQKVKAMNSMDIESGTLDPNGGDLSLGVVNNVVGYGNGGPVLLSDGPADRIGQWGFHGGDGQPTAATPPTYVRVTEFTESFQGIVNTYGVPRYREANPAVLTVVTFPFMFGVMYGDVGHGSFVVLFAFAMILLYPTLRKSSDELVGIMRSGRWILFLAGLFGVYAGFLYNDLFALGMDLFGSRYAEKTVAGSKEGYHYYAPTDTVYPFGLDPVWRGSSNEIEFTNSIKMKLAVLFGFVHMMFGLTLKLSNCIHYRSGLDFFFEWLPQVIFMCCLVGYLDFLIVFKWATPINAAASNKPQLINLVIEMFFFTAPKDVMFPAQATVQLVCVGLIYISIPIMLFPKPFMVRRQHRKEQAHKKKEKELSTTTDDPHRTASYVDGFVDRTKSGIDASSHPDHDPSHKQIQEEEEEFNFQEVFIHQMIETIEFALGTISNTASYLRLWALSLAHQQLSHVILQYSLLFILNMDGVSSTLAIVSLIVIFPVFFVLTMAIMLAMESLECYLHALRLHWVEFQNKFFKADGYAFNPFRLHKAMIIKQAIDDSK